ncbi:MAG: hypothetical protein DI536_02200 [Archangium gephyra]|uniref:Uncharacterized protein n=1 Tax=Archangium gephyra TaxID=48 RepID=A0A2W5W688_9BACT|nr:MAG: hypothetical protein DI536_02200 [Archangium gephyra]
MALDPLSNGNTTTPVDDPHVPAGAPPPPAKVTEKKNEVVHLPSGVDATDERFELDLREQIGRLDPNESLELSCLGQAKVPVLNASFEANAKVSIKKDSSGGFTVAMEGEGAAGDVDGTNRVGVGAAVKYHCETKAQAADLARALSTSLALESASAANVGVSLYRTGARLFGQEGQTLSSTQRVFEYSKGLKELRLDVFDRTKLDEMKTSISKSEGKLDVRGSFTVDFEKNEVRQTIALVSSQKGSAFFPIVVAAELSAKEAASVVITYKISPEVAKKLAEGKISQSDALASALAGAPTSYAARGEVEVGGKGRWSNAADSKVKLSAEKKLDAAMFKNGVDAAAVYKALAQTKWTATQETGVGYGMGFDLSVAKGEYRTTHKKTTTVTEPTSLQAAWEVVTKHVNDLDANDFDARRAASLLGA